MQHGGIILCLPTLFLFFHFHTFDPVLFFFFTAKDFLFHTVYLLFLLEHADVDYHCSFTKYFHPTLRNKPTGEVTCTDIGGTDSDLEEASVHACTVGITEAKHQKAAASLKRPSGRHDNPL